MKSMGTNEAMTGNMGDVQTLSNTKKNSNENTQSAGFRQSHPAQFYQQEQKEGQVTSGKPSPMHQAGFGDPTNITSQRTGGQSFEKSMGGPRNEYSSASPQSKHNNHQRLADELMLGNEQIQYGLSSNQTTHRMGGIITSSQPPAGNPIYLKNAIAQCTHMPSKGVYNNYQKLSQRPY